LENRVNRHWLFLAAIAATSVVACATVDQQPTTSAGDKLDRVYTTGSRIPVRDRNSGSADVKSVENQDVKDIMNQRDSIVPSKGSGM
jgi:hypothetical protein